MYSFTIKEVENIFETGRIIQNMIYNKHIEIEDSKEAFAAALYLGKKFEEVYDDENGFYYADLEEFVEKHLFDAYGMMKI